MRPGFCALETVRVSAETTKVFLPYRTADAFAMLGRCRFVRREIFQKRIDQGELVHFVAELRS